MLEWTGSSVFVLVASSSAFVLVQCLCELIGIELDDSLYDAPIFLYNVESVIPIKEVTLR